MEDLKTKKYPSSDTDDLLNVICKLFHKTFQGIQSQQAVNHLRCIFGFNEIHQWN